MNWLAAVSKRFTTAGFVDVDAWQVAYIEEALAEAESGAPGVLHRAGIAAPKASQRS